MTATESHSPREQYRRGKDELRGLSEELAGIAADVRDITRTEVELAKAELKEQVRLAARTALWGGMAVVLALVTLIFAFTALMFVLDGAMPLWAAALLTFGTALFLTAFAGATAFGTIKRITVVPTQTITSVKEDVRWAGAQLKSSLTSNASDTP